MSEHAKCRVKVNLHPLKRLFQRVTSALKEEQSSPRIYYSVIIVCINKSKLKKQNRQAVWAGASTGM